MRKKGFTLIELLAVIFIISIISVIAIPNIDRAIKQAREELYQTQLNNIITGAKNWGSKNISILPEEDGELITLTLGQLKIGGFIDEKIKNPRTKKTFPNDMEITILKKGNNYEYKVIEGSGGFDNNIDFDSPTIVLNGLPHETVEIYDEYIDKGVIARDPSGSEIEDINITIKSNNNVVESIDTSKLVQYKITYSVTYNGTTTSAIRTVTVKDTIPPILTIPGNIELGVDVVSSFDAMEGVTATDNSLKEPTITTSGSLSTLPGTYYITYTAIDESGNKTTKTRTVNVVDNVKPLVTFGTNGSSAYAKSRSTKVTISDDTGVNTSSLKYLWNTSTSIPSEGSFTNTFTNGGTITSPSGVTGGYYLWILAKDVLGNTAITRSNVFNLDNINPVISGITINATNITYSSFTITRSGNATDAHSGLATNPYLYQRSTDNSTWTTVCTNNTTSCNITGLNETKTYYYRICTKDLLGNQSCTASKDVRTLHWTCGDDIIDTRDGNTYKTTKIGDQCWFAENLKYTGNGCLKKTWDSSDTGPVDACKANGDEIHYQWVAAMNGSTEDVQGLCPSGWHIPTDAEWDILVNYAGGSSTAGKKLKAVDGNGTDDYGFNGLLVGYRGTSGALYGVGSYVYWWSSSPSGSNAWSHSVFSSGGTVRHLTYPQANGYSVRCILKVIHLY